MLVSDYNYDLPEERIAKFPPKERGSAGEYQADERAGVPRLSCRISGR